MALAVTWEPCSAVAALLCLLLPPDLQWHCQDEMSYTGLTVPGMTEPSRRYDITITVDRDGGHLPNPAGFAVTAQRAALARGAAIVSAHTAGQIICVVTIRAVDRFTAVAAALAVVSEALRRPVASLAR